MTQAALHAARRERVLRAIGEDSAMVLGAAPELVTGRDTEVRYVPDPELYYLTGYVEPEAVLVLKPSDVASPFTMFVRPRDAKLELWTGPRGGVEHAVEQVGADSAWPVTELDRRLPELLADVDTVYARMWAQRPDLDAAMTAALVAARKARPKTGCGPHALIDPGSVLDDMRLSKDATEIAALREAARITVEAFDEAARRIGPEVGEWELEAAVDSAFRRRGASGPAFPTIAASGANATVLHYTTNDRRMRAGELILLDAGARNDMYCADITRTFPVGAGFEGAARAVYEIVHAAHEQAIAAVRPGATVKAVHEAALRVLAQGMLDLGLLNGDIDALLTGDEAVSRFYPHRTSHWLGLEAHDPGDYMRDGRPRVLEPGMVLTIEPGLYIPTEANDVPAELRGVGVRIEDDVLVTEAGHDVLTSALPARADEVAALAG